MTEVQTAEYLQALLASITVSVIIPLVMVSVMAVFLWWLLWRAQQKSTFDISYIFIDNDSLKVSPWRLVSLGAFVFSVWYLVADKTSGKADPQVFRDFLIFWSGTPVAMVLANKWDGRLPFTKGPENG